MTQATFNALYTVITSFWGNFVKITDWLFGFRLIDLFRNLNFRFLIFQVNLNPVINWLSDFNILGMNLGYIIEAPVILLVTSYLLYVSLIFFILKIFLP